uniref:Uncharacterized protein n=1 Tax=Anopheles aquasalis TaxID=42839 RepID=T1E8L4_ANOAQ
MILYCARSSVITFHIRILKPSRQSIPYAFNISSSSSSISADSSSCFSSFRASTYWISSSASSAPSTSMRRADCWASSFARRSLRPIAGERMRAMFFCTSTMSRWISWSRAFRSRSMMKWHSRRCLISLIFFTASIVLFHSSRLYLIGTLRRFSNSKLGSTVSSFSCVLRYARVQRILRGFFFLLNARRHLDRQNRNSLQSFRTKTLPCPGKILLEQKKHVSIRIFPA